jgi:hypothetical protein
MTASWTVSDANNAALAAYKAMRISNDNMTLTTDQVLAEMFAICSGSVPVKVHGNRFAP